MYKVEYLFEGKWEIAIEIGSKTIAIHEFNRLSPRYLTRISGPDYVSYHFDILE